MNKSYRYELKLNWDTKGENNKTHSFTAAGRRMKHYRFLNLHGRGSTNFYM